MELLREYPRFNVRYRVRLVGEGIVAEGEMYNLSVAGCAVESEMSMQQGDYIELDMYVPGDESPLKVDLAGVRWATRREFGVQFVTISNADRKKLQEHLSHLHQALNAMGT